MKSSIAVTPYDTKNSQSSVTSEIVHFRELSQVEIIYAMQKEDMCRLAKDINLTMTSEGNSPLYIQPGPGSCMF